MSIGFSPVRRALLQSAALLAVPTWAQQPWPARPVRWVVPFPPGGTTDVVTRLIATEMSRSLGQSVIVENKPGAGTVIGVDFVAKAPPDGYTMITVANSFCANQTLVKNLPYDGAKDLVPVALMGLSEHVLVANPGLGVKTLGEFAALVRRQPGKISYASFGNGTSAHLSGAMLESEEYEAIKADYDEISRAHFSGSYFAPADMSFAQSDAIFPTGDLADTLGREYETQCTSLCLGPYPPWPEVLARFEQLRDRL